MTWTPAAENCADDHQVHGIGLPRRTGGAPVSSCTPVTIAQRLHDPWFPYGPVYYVDMTATNRAGTAHPAALARPGCDQCAERDQHVREGEDDSALGSPVGGKAVDHRVRRKAVTKASGGTLVGTAGAPYGKTSCKTKKIKKRSKYYIALTTNTTVGSFTVTPRT